PPLGMRGREPAAGSPRSALLAGYLPALLAGAVLGKQREAATAVQEVVAEPIADLDEVLDAAERGSGPSQLVRFVRHPHEADLAPVRTQDREELLGLGDRAPQVALGVLDEEWGPDPRRGGQRRLIAEDLRLLPGRRPELDRRE